MRIKYKILYDYIEILCDFIARTKATFNRKFCTLFLHSKYKASTPDEN